MIDKDQSGHAHEEGDCGCRGQRQGANAASYDRVPFNLRDSVICGTTRTTASHSEEVTRKSDVPQ